MKTQHRPRRGGRRSSTSSNQKCRGKQGLPSPDATPLPVAAEHPAATADRRHAAGAPTAEDLGADLAAANAATRRLLALCERWIAQAEAGTAGPPRRGEDLPYRLLLACAREITRQAEALVGLRERRENLDRMRQFQDQVLTAIGRAAPEVQRAILDELQDAGGDEDLATLAGRTADDATSTPGDRPAEQALAAVGPDGRAGRASFLSAGGRAPRSDKRQRPPPERES